jgi:hypothetical protein
MVPRVTHHTSRSAAAGDAGTSSGGHGVAGRRAHRDVIPASPPPEVGEQIRAAQRLIDELDARGRELRFDTRDGRVHVELRDRDGNVLREIAPSQAVDIAGWARWVE